MLDFKVVRFVGRDGTEVVLLTDLERKPFFWPNVYATGEFAQAGMSPETIVKVLRPIGMARMWAAAEGMDLDREIRHGDFLGVNAVKRLADFLRLSAPGQVKRAALLGGVARLPSGKGLERVRPGPKTSRPALAEADPEEAKARILYVAAYLEWTLEQRLGTMDRRRENSGVLKEVAEAVIARLRAAAPRAKGDDEDEENLEGVDEEVVALIDHALQPGAPDNPFKSAFVQARTRLKWLLLRDTGGRRGEIRETKVQHVLPTMRRLEIRTSKTIARTVPITAETAAAFDDFIETHWAKLPREARRRGWLFTDKAGRHLSLRAFNRAFEGLRGIEGVPARTSPHTMRRTWNDNFSAMLDRLPPDKRPSPEQEVKMRNRLQGWSGKSTMGGRYARRHIRRSSDALAEKLLEGFPTPSRPGEGAAPAEGGAGDAPAGPRPGGAN